MDTTDLLERYKNHPLGHALQACEATTEWRELHIYFITAKTTIHLLRFQGELTKTEEDSLVAMLYQITDVKLGEQPTAH